MATWNLNIPKPPADPLHQYPGVAWVDQANGNDTTGAEGRFDLPFASVSAAIAALGPLGTVIVMGDYTLEDVTLNSNTVFFDTGALDTNYCTVDGTGLMVVASCTPFSEITLSGNIIIQGSRPFTGTMPMIYVVGGSVRLVEIQAWVEVDSGAYAMLDRCPGAYLTNNGGGGVAIAYNCTDLSIGGAAVQAIGCSVAAISGSMHRLDMCRTTLDWSNIVTASRTNVGMPTLVIPKTTNWTVAAEECDADASARRVDASSSGSITCTVPTDATVIPVGHKCRVMQTGTGTVAIAPASGVTLNSRGGARTLAGQWAQAMLEKTGSNTWTLTGDIIA